MGATAPSEHDLVHARLRAKQCLAYTEAAIDPTTVEAAGTHWCFTRVQAHKDVCFEFDQALPVGRLRLQGAGEGAAIGSSCSWQQRQPQALAGQQVRKENPEAPCQAKRQRRVRLNSGAVFCSHSHQPLAVRVLAVRLLRSPESGGDWLSGRIHLPLEGRYGHRVEKKKSFHLFISGPATPCTRTGGETNTRRQSLAALQIAKPTVGGFTYKTSLLGAARAIGRHLSEGPRGRPLLCRA